MLVIWILHLQKYQVISFLKYFWLHIFTMLSNAVWIDKGILYCATVGFILSWNLVCYELFLKIKETFSNLILYESLKHIETLTPEHPFMSSKVFVPLHALPLLYIAINIEWIINWLHVIHLAPNVGLLFMQRQSLFSVCLKCSCNESLNAKGAATPNDHRAGSCSQLWSNLVLFPSWLFYF